MSFRMRLKTARKPTQPRLRFELEKLRDEDVACTFQSNGKWEIRITHWGMRTWTSIPRLPPTIQQCLMQPLRYLGMDVSGKSLWSPEMFSNSVMRREIWSRRSKKNYSEANKRIQKVVMKTKDRYSVRGNWNLPAEVQLQYQCKSSSRRWAALGQGYKCSPDKWQNGRMVQKNSRSKAMM